MPNHKFSLPHVQLATLVDHPPDTEDWVHEIKYDGYRILAIKKGKKVSLFSRNHKDWSDKFKPIVNKIKQLPIKNAILDGEIVLLNEKGQSDFQLLQNALYTELEPPFVYYIFDCLSLNTKDVRTLPLLERKGLLRTILLTAGTTLRYSDHVQGKGLYFYKQACKLGLEGIVSKLATSIYEEKRSKTWLKSKCIQRQEFVIGGFSLPQGARYGFGSLYLGVYDQGNLVYVGNVGTGFTDASLHILSAELKKIISPKNPFNTLPPKAKQAIWVKPKLIAEVTFSEWTKDQHLRHPSFKGLRTDKKPREIGKENSHTTKPT